MTLQEHIDENLHAMEYAASAVRLAMNLEPSARRLSAHSRQLAHKTILHLTVIVAMNADTTGEDYELESRKELAKWTPPE